MTEKCFFFAISYTIGYLKWYLQIFFTKNFQWLMGSLIFYLVFNSRVISYISEDRMGNIFYFQTF